MRRRADGVVVEAIDKLPQSTGRGTTGNDAIRAFALDPSQPKSAPAAAPAATEDRPAAAKSASVGPPLAAAPKPSAVFREEAAKQKQPAEKRDAARDALGDVRLQDADARAGRRPDEVLGRRSSRIDGFGFLPATRADEARLALSAKLADRAAKDSPADPQLPGLVLSRIGAAYADPAPLPLREFAQPRPNPDAGAARSDFAETLLWKPCAVTDASGSLTLPFHLADAVSGYRVVVAGHSADGRLGAATSVIDVRKPVALSAKLPPELCGADTLNLPVTVTNAGEGQNVALSFNQAGAEGVERVLKLPARGEARTLWPIRPSGNRLTLSLSAEPTLPTLPGSTAGRDALSLSIPVVPDGFPVAGAASATVAGAAKLTLTLPETWIPGSLAPKLAIYPSAMGQALGGLDGMLREPYGCFEQTSSVNYPNLLVLDYLQQTGQAKPELVARAKEYLERGYARLVGFECPVTGENRKLGFEWFGAADRPHEALTAYGLVQFADLARVFPVDGAMVARTRAFLASKRDGKGGFSRRPDPHGFGQVPDAVYHAYLAWALATADRLAGTPSDYGVELAALLKRCDDAADPHGQDPYVMALVALAHQNAGRGRLAEGLLRRLANRQDAAGLVQGARTSIVNSGGSDLVTEATSLAALAWLGSPTPEFATAAAGKAVRALQAQRKASGHFGSTQATVLALKALVAHAQASRADAEVGQVVVKVNGTTLPTTTVNTANFDPLELAIDPKLLKPGANEVTLESTLKAALPVTASFEARTLVPAGNERCLVRLDTGLAAGTLAEGNSTRLGVRLTNSVNRPHGMATAVVGIPAGLRLPADLKQLKALTERPADGSEPTLGYFETNKRELVLYWRSLAPSQVISLDLDVVAEVPGNFRGAASRAYLYYDSDAKFWAAPLAATVEPAGAK